MGVLDFIFWFGLALLAVLLLGRVLERWLPRAGGSLLSAVAVVALWARIAALIVLPLILLDLVLISSTDSKGVDLYVPWIVGAVVAAAVVVWLSLSGEGDDEDAEARER